MSYRLINANTIAESYTEVHDMPCIYADLPRGLDGGHYDMRGMDELQSENAKLRERVAELEELTDGKLYIPQEWYQLAMTENAKLRELVRWMYNRMDESCAVQHPYAPAPINYDQLMQAAVRARELGVEVAE